jgi:hypothetical protein
MRFARVPLTLLVAFSLASACTDATAPRERSPLAGLDAGMQLDSAGSPLTPPDGPVAPGYFRGTVRGPNIPGIGGDTLGTSPRIANVVVKAFPIVAQSGAQLTLGALAATTTTNAQGQFTLPELPGGEYAVTFTPPAGSSYTGVWVTAQANAESHLWPWWVTLPRS